MNRIDQIVDVLDLDDALAIGDSPWGLSPENNNLDRRQVDWEGLFPARNPERGQHDWELFGDKWELDTGTLDEIFNEADDSDHPTDFEPEDWDVCAWYQSIHFFGFDWGIFVREDCLKRLASKIYRASNIRATALAGSQRSCLAKGLIRTAFSTLYHHEYYHFKTECLALRLHAVLSRPSYVPYMNSVYRVVAGTDAQVEEALANAYMYRTLDDPKWIAPSLARATREYLTKSFPRNPPGYRIANRYLGDKDFDTGQMSFFSQVLQGQVTPTHLPSYWRIAPRINQAFLNIKSDIWTVVPSGSKPIVPSMAQPLRTCSSSELVKLCGKRGYIVTPGGKGSHIKLKKVGNPTIIIPGNRDNVSPGVIKNVLASLGYKLTELPALL